VTRGRPTYYLARKAELPGPVLATARLPETPLALHPAVDRVSRAPAIADRLNITERQFYRMVENPTIMATMPIKKRPILGWTGDGPTLDRWWAAFVRGEI
jgi:hypothetical protein